MSKSLGNFFTVGEISGEFDWRVVRLFLLVALPEPGELLPVR